MSVPARVALTAQTASIGSTTLLTGTAATGGVYRIDGYLMSEVAAAAGTVSVTFGWTDENGAQTLVVGAPLVLTAKGNAVGGQVIRVAASTNVTYLTTVVGNIGGSYALHAVLGCP